jgi:hypothetical protein
MASTATAINPRANCHAMILLFVLPIFRILFFSFIVSPG